MGLFFWKDNKKIDAFANAVAEDLYSHIQPMGHPERSLQIHIISTLIYLGTLALLLGSFELMGGRKPDARKLAHAGT